MEAIISACITGGLALVGILITNVMSNKAIENKLVTGQAVTDEKIDQLRKEVEKHNNVVEKVPVLEARVDGISKKVDILEDRVNNLDRGRHNDR